MEHFLYLPLFFCMRCLAGNEVIELKLDEFAQRCSKVGIYEYEPTENALVLARSVKGTPERVWMRRMKELFGPRLKECQDLPHLAFSFENFEPRDGSSESFRVHFVIRGDSLELNSKDWPEWVKAQLRPLAIVGDSIRLDVTNPTLANPSHQGSDE
ncbi:MAG: hypothetical protein Q7Q71_04995 [Verrucomicrobiota bacterium JB023]|nr:hypothetical protein [Verrucomicrobiota bacterium JB023]